MIISKSCQPLLFESLEDGGVKRVKGGLGTDLLLKTKVQSSMFQMNEA